jgi:pimeloyl-ACP methyl ester carboxylesterase
VTGGELSVTDFPAQSGSTETLVLLHGFSFDASSWRAQIAAFTAHFRVIAYDLRGFGRSSPPVAGRNHVDDLGELLAALGVEAAHLVGLSLGGNVALGALVERPELVRSAVLASSGLPGHVRTSPRPPDEAEQHARQFGIDAGRRFWFAHPVFAPARAIPAVRSALEQTIDGFSGWQWRTDLEQGAPLPEVSDRLGEISAPTLVLNGALDVVGYRDIARLLAAGIPGAEHAEFSDAGHLLNMERPAEFNAVVLRHLASVPRPSRPSVPSPGHPDEWCVNG